jgi:hypothetical protein
MRSAEDTSSDADATYRPSIISSPNDAITIRMDARAERDFSAEFPIVQRPG